MSGVKAGLSCELTTYISYLAMAQILDNALAGQLN